jgi:hypothetical protein
LDPYWIRIRIGLQHQTLDPDPEKMNTDPQPYTVTHLLRFLFVHKITDAAIKIIGYRISDPYPAKNDRYGFRYDKDPFGQEVRTC